jgi:FkbM family methyltransferase
MLWWKGLGSRQPKEKQSASSSVEERKRFEPPNLIDIQSRILGRNEVFTVIDAEAAHGWWTEHYLTNFARSCVLAIEPSPDNVAGATARLARFGDRVELINANLGSTVSLGRRQSNSDHSTQSEFETVTSRYNADPLVLSAPYLLPEQKIDSLTVDHICAERAIESVGILRLHIRGLGLEALKGAERMLSRGAIRIVMIRVGFVQFPGELPAFGPVCEYLRRFGYELQGIYDEHRDPPTPDVLRNAETIFLAPVLQARSEIPSLPVVLNETIETVEGHRLADKFLKTVRLQDGAVIRVQSQGAARTANEAASIMNTIIDTSCEPYRYSVVCDTDREVAGQFHEDGLVVAEVTVKVLAGKAGILWVDQDYQPLEARERHVSAMPDVQRVLVSAAVRHAHHLVVRNVANESTRTSFSILRTRTKIVDDSFRRRVFDASGAEALYLRGWVLERAGDREGAARMFSEATALVADYAPALEGEAEALDMVGKSGTAATKYAAVRKLKADNQKGPPDRCLPLRRHGQFTDEIAAYTSVLHSMKRRTLPYIMRGNALLAEGRADAALADYEAALSLNATLHEITALKGEALAMLGCYQEALEAFDVAVAARSEDPEIMGGRAIVHLALGKLEAADADWRRQLDLLSPTLASARACVALRLADYEAALPELERALTQKCDDPYWKLYRLTALNRLGRPPMIIAGTDIKRWPGPLLALHAGQINGDEVLAQADNSDRHAEAQFQLATLAFQRDQEEARHRWMKIINYSRPDLIEHAAARHELARLDART